MFEETRSTRLGLSAPESGSPVVSWPLWACVCVCRCLVRGMRAEGLWKECEVRSQVLSTTRRPNPTWPDRVGAGAGK